MIVIADTSPINYLVLIDEVDVLPKLFPEIVIPLGVLVELQSDETPEKVREWANNHPSWLKVEASELEFDPYLATLGRGEHEAIVARGLRVVGTLFILRAAFRLSILDLPEALAKLKRTHFRISSKILQTLLDDE